MGEDLGQAKEYRAGQTGHFIALCEAWSCKLALSIQTNTVRSITLIDDAIEEISNMRMNQEFK